MHNLKNVEVKIPRNQMVVVTGLSGSGKSTLVFDTIFAEGQRRYVESLSAYARQFLGRVSKPDVDFITGIPPAIAIEQKVNTRNPRSTVGTSTEIYDYLKLLFARVGSTISPVSGVEVKRHTVTDVVNYIAGLSKSTRLYILAPISLNEKMGLIEKLTILQQEGFTRLEAGGKEWRIEELLPVIDKHKKNKFRLLIDRLTATNEEEALSRVADSIQTAFEEGKGFCMVESPDGTVKQEFSAHFEADGMMFEEPTEHLFSFNNPLGACPRCEGYGRVIGIDEDLVVPDRSLSIFNGAVACWRGEVMKEYKGKLIRSAAEFDFPIHRPYYELTDAQRKLLWDGNRYFTGLHEFFSLLEENKYKIQYRVMLSRYTGKTLCPDCQGSRLRKEAGYVKVGGKSISELVLLPVGDLLKFMQNLQLSDYAQSIAGRALIEIVNRLQFLLDVGLGYLTLNRLSNTLSGGESQRINLATSLGSSLVGSLYILDEPSIGLHPRDTQRLIKVLKQLRDLGNTVLVVEHDEEIMRAADRIIDIGPAAGLHGGEIVFEGEITNYELRIRNQESGIKYRVSGSGKQKAETNKQINKSTNNQNSLTLSYLLGQEQIEVPVRRKKWNNYIEVAGARENNLKNITVKFPLGCMVAVTGVSGSGKSSLVKNILYPALNKLINQYGEKPGAHDFVRGDIKQLRGVEMIDQNPIGKSSRSNPITYIKAYDEIRKLYSEQPYAKQNGYGHSHFSFNIDGGRCEECQGDGFIKVEMQFMADVTLLCEACGGKRFKHDILEVRYKGYNIADVLDFTVDQAIAFFSEQKETLAKKIALRLKPLQDVGLGYIKLGQSSNTLSGGESRRVKLAAFLGEANDNNPRLFIFDEPTTGLHFHDIKKLLASFNALIARGHSIVVVEHNMDVVKCADWLIDLGPEGGEQGGHLVFEGMP
ncbi:MAG: ATP-binding cassette domain-containing protein, partial [Prevotellaceae bacterium]|nr:ATP-binding cassette domain-containing protein [Prevotellaceae bacterium]